MLTEQLKIPGSVPLDQIDKAIKYMKLLAESGPTAAISHVKQIIQRYEASGLDAADSLNIKLTAATFETEDLQIGVDSLLKNGPGKATFIGR